MRFIPILAAALLVAACESVPPDAPPAGGSTPAAGVPASAHRASAPMAAPANVRAPAYDRPGYEAFVADGRLWVFANGSDDARGFAGGREPGKFVTLIRGGPSGMTLRAVDQESLKGYLAAREGFVTEIVDGRIWVFRPGTEELAEFRTRGEPAKFVTRPAAGPGNMTVRGPDTATVVEYLTARPGFVTRESDGRLWVFREGAAELAEYAANGEPAKFVTRPKEGPLGLTLRAPDPETIAEYMASAPGFVTHVVDGRIWVFRPGTEELAEFRTKGEPAKFVTRPGAGPLRMTVRGPDSDILDDYLRTTTAQ